MYEKKIKPRGGRLEVEDLPEHMKFFLRNLYSGFGHNQFTHDQAREIEGVNEKWLIGLWKKGYLITDKNGITINSNVNLCDEDDLFEVSDE
jgi:hypothetical protein